MKPIEIQRRMKVRYVDACLSVQQVYRCTGQFMNGISSVTDCPRPGQAHPVVTPQANTAQIIQKDTRISEASLPELTTADYFRSTIGTNIGFRVSASHHLF